MYIGLTASARMLALLKKKFLRVAFERSDSTTSTGSPDETSSPETILVERSAQSRYPLADEKVDMLKHVWEVLHLTVTIMVVFYCNQSLLMTITYYSSGTEMVLRHRASTISSGRV